MTGAHPPRPAPAGRGCDTDLVDHVGALVTALGDTSDRLHRAGFRTTPAVDLLRPDDDGEMVPSGGRQRCVMLHRGYLEIQAIEDPHRPHPLRDRALRYQGWHVLALRTADAAGFGAVARAGGVPVGGVQRWRRPTATAGAEAEFSFVVVEPDRTPEALVIATQHHTPDLVRPTGCTDQPNGALAVAEVLVVTADPGDVADRYRRLTGRAGVDDGSGGHRFTGGADAVTVGDHDWLTRRCPVRPPGPDALAAVVLTVADVDRFARHLGLAPTIDHGVRAGVRWFQLAGTALVVGAVPEEERT